MQSLHTMQCFLEPELRVTGVKLESLIDYKIVGHRCGSASSGTAAVLGNNVVLDETLSDTAIDAIAEKQVGAATSVTRNLALTGSLKELSLECSGVLTKSGNILGHEISHHARGVRAGHRSTGEEVDDGVTCAPCAQDLLARGIDVDALANVGEAGDLVADVNGTDGDNLRVGATKMGWGGATRIRTIISSGYGDVNTGL